MSLIASARHAGPWAEEGSPAGVPKFASGVLPVLLLVGGWRLIQFAAAIVATQLGNDAPPQSLAEVLIRSAVRWDAGWYLTIARDGYSLGATPEAQSNVAFYPLLPLLIHLVHFVVPSWRLAGIIVVNLALVGAAIYLDRLVRLDYDGKTALRAVAILLLLPSAPFLGAVYTESLLLLTMIAAIYHARRGQWWLAGLWGAGAALTKMVGAILLVPLLWEWQRGTPRRPLHLLALGLIPAGALAFLAYVHWRFGSYSVYFNVQRGWYRDSFFQPFLSDAGTLLSGFWRNDPTVINYFYPQAGATRPSPGAFMVFDLACLLLALILGIAIFFRMRPSYGMVVLGVLSIAAFSGSPQSFNRFVLILFPIPIALALLARRPIVGFALLLFGGLLGAYHLLLFVNGFWAG